MLLCSPLNCILYEQRDRFGALALLVDADVLRMGSAAILKAAQNKCYILGHPEHMCAEVFTKVLAELQKKVCRCYFLLRQMLSSVRHIYFIVICMLLSISLN